jgi:hypothetical protein
VGHLTISSENALSSSIVSLSPFMHRFLTAECLCEAALFSYVRLTDVSEVDGIA